MSNSTVNLCALPDHDTPRHGADALEVRGSQVRYPRHQGDMQVRRVQATFSKPDRYRLALIVMAADEWSPLHALDVPATFWSEPVWFARPTAFLARQDAL
jgi:hypothetical protein